MKNKICFDTNYFAAVVLVGLAIIGYTLYQVKLNGSINYDLINDNVETILSKSHSNVMKDLLDSQQEEAHMYSQHQEHPHEPGSKDYHRMANPLVPPLRRHTATGLYAHQIPINSPTREEYGTFQQVGSLTHPKNPDYSLPLFGRRIHSNKYEYYAIHHNGNIKIDVESPRGQEFTTNDKVTVKGYPGTFKVALYEFDQPRYIPY